MGWKRRMPFAGDHLREQGQMVVEMAVTLPVVLMVMVVVVDGLTFMGECAAFDHAVPQAVIACATSPGVEEVAGQSREDAVLAEIKAGFDEERNQIEVTSTSGFAGAVVYTATLRTVPWPLAPSGRTFLGMSVPALLEHSYSFAVMPVEVVS